VTYQPDPGMTLAAVEAMGSQQTFTRAQVAYLVAVAYEVGRRHTLSEDLAETIACWDEHDTPRDVRARRVAARISAMTSSHASDYLGGPVDWETGQPVRDLGAAA
jgi:hypothetical protein